MMRHFNQISIKSRLRYYDRSLLVLFVLGLVIYIGRPRQHRHQEDSNLQINSKASGRSLSSYSKILPYNVSPVLEEPGVKQSPQGTPVSFVNRKELAGHSASKIGNFQVVRKSHYLLSAPVPPSERIFLYDKTGSVANTRTKELPEQIHSFDKRKSFDISQISGSLGQEILNDVMEYFQHLESPQMVCKKLVILGGAPTCEQHGNFLDGNKAVCMDPELEVFRNGDPSGCLTLSFGVNFDTTFDSAVAALPCEVHMFDVLDFSPVRLLDKSHVHFHKVGLAEVERTNFYSDINQSIPVNSLDGLMVNYDLVGRPIHILKLDIEDDEWEVFKHLVEQPILDIVGQIAMEIHAEGLPEKSPIQRLNFIQRRYDILRAIEGRGFRLVAYWPNRQLNRYQASEGKRSYDLCGELLYINSNWYDTTFKRDLKNVGFQFI